MIVLNTSYSKQKGFTLIELMIAVAIIAILGAVAMPSYQNYVMQANRAAAKTILHENAQFLEQFYTTNNLYTGAVLPFLQSPRTGAVAHYNVSLQAVAAATYTLQAVPVGMMAADTCGALTLTNTGVRGAGGDVATCWNR